MDLSPSRKVSPSRGSVHSVGYKIFEPLVGPSTFVELIEFSPLGGPSILWTTQNFYPLGGPSTLQTRNFHPQVRSCPLGGPSTSVDSLQIYPLEGSSTLWTKIFHPLMRSRPLGGPSTLWTYYILYTLEGPSTLWTKIFESLVGPSILGLSSFSPFRRFVHSVDQVEFLPSKESVHFCGLYIIFTLQGVRSFCGLTRILSSKTQLILNVLLFKKKN